MSSSSFEDLYDDFEATFGRRAIGDRLWRELRAQVAAGDAGRVPARDEVERLLDRFLPVGFDRCVGDDYPEPKPGCLRDRPGACGNRCSSGYWRKHSLEVAANMRRIAGWLGADEQAFEAAGLVHDIDYLKYPHHNRLVDSEAAHPISVVTLLAERGVRPSFCLAILEHAPHLGHDPSSPLASALAACDEHSTICGSGARPRFDDDLPRSLVDCLRPEAGPAITGYVRPDVHDRMNAALRALSGARRSVA